MTEQNTEFEPRLTKTDDPDWDCLIFRNKSGEMDFRLIPAARHVLYDQKGIPVDVLHCPSELGLEQMALGYKRVNHDVADAAREFLNPGPQYTASSESNNYAKSVSNYIREVLK
jgi:hypothetical protein